MFLYCTINSNSSVLLELKVQISFKSSSRKFVRIKSIKEKKTQGKNPQSKGLNHVNVGENSTEKMTSVSLEKGRERINRIIGQQPIH